MKTARGKGLAFRPVLKILAACAAVLAPLPGSIAYGQALAQLYTPKAAIPEDSYKSWSLFLVNNPQWVVAESNRKLKSLYDQFQAFGRAIGRDHLAVWFWSQDIRQDSFYYSAVDVIRSAAFCQKLELPPGNGPYLFVTTDYPGPGLINDLSSFLPAAPRTYYTVSLNNRSADEAIQLLTRIADKITAERIADLKRGAANGWSSWWQRAFEEVRDFLRQREMKVTFKTPVSEVEIK